MSDRAADAGRRISTSSDPPSGPPSESSSLSDEGDRRIADLVKADRAAASLGMEITDVGSGRAEVCMLVRDDMANGDEFCHGGLIFALADTAFAYACNSHGPTAVAAAASIDFVNPGRVGTVLTASAVEEFRRGRTGLYDVTVTDDTGELVARFHGRSHTIGG